MSEIARLPTSLSVRLARQRIVLDDLRAHPELVEQVDDIARLPRLTGWAPSILDVAVADLVARGVLTDDATGRLCVHPERWEKA
ncbi:MAG: hypothetical protein ACR2HC_05895 [Thermoleophilaceae bacterium]